MSHRERLSAAQLDSPKTTSASRDGRLPPSFGTENQTRSCVEQAYGFRSNIDRLMVEARIQKHAMTRQIDRRQTSLHFE